MRRRTEKGWIVVPMVLCFAVAVILSVWILVEGGTIKWPEIKWPQRRPALTAGQTQALIGLGMLLERVDQLEQQKRAVPVRSFLERPSLEERPSEKKNLL